jgi:hypothetical protein
VDEWDSLLMREDARRAVDEGKSLAQEPSGVIPIDVTGDSYLAAVEQQTVDVRRTVGERPDLEGSSPESAVNSLHGDVGAHTAASVTSFSAA